MSIAEKLAKLENMTVVADLLTEEEIINRGEKVSSELESTAASATDYDMQELAYERMQTKIIELEEKIAAMQEDYDNQYKDEFLQMLSNLIVDSSSANSASITYDKNWFSKQLFSIAVKQEIAATLINLCNKQQANSANGFWTKLIENNDSALMSAEYQTYEE